METLSLEIETPHRSLAQIAADTIRVSIIRKELRLDQPLTETALSQALEISKTPVREALSLLKSERLVVSETHKGYRVFSMNQQELVQFCELRFALESQALCYGAKRDRSGLTQQLELILERMMDNQGESERENYLSLDTQFHQAFFEASGNRFLTEHYNSINSIIETIRHYISQTNDATQTSLKDHRALVEQVANGRLEEAVRQLEKHIVNWSRRAILEPVLL
jgi:DNA-binding GntR family transcriptional regulator